MLIISCWLFFGFFFNVKVQIHAVISCHTKWALLSFHFVVIFWLPPWSWPFLSLVMISSTWSYKKLAKTGLVTSHWSHSAIDSLTKNAPFGTFSTTESGPMVQRMTSPVDERTQAVALYFSSKRKNSCIFRRNSLPYDHLNARSLIRAPTRRDWIVS